MELATPHKEEVIKLVDRVGGFEWMIQKHEIDGATALKLDLSLDTPIIVIPRNSTSKELVLESQIMSLALKCDVVPFAFPGHWILV